MTRCEAIASADEYCKFETQCELEENHEGPHKVFLGGCSFRLWENIKVKMNFQPKTLKELQEQWLDSEKRQLEWHEAGVNVTISITRARIYRECANALEPFIEKDKK